MRVISIIVYVYISLSVSDIIVNELQAPIHMTSVTCLERIRLSRANKNYSIFMLFVGMMVVVSFEL